MQLCLAIYSLSPLLCSLCLHLRATVVAEPVRASHHAHMCDSKSWLTKLYADVAEETPSTPRALPSTETNNGPITNGITTPETTTFTKPTPFTNTNAIPSYEPSTPNAVNGKGNGYAYNGQQQQEQDDMPQAPTTTYRKTTTTLAPISTQQNPISA